VTTYAKRLSSPHPLIRARSSEIRHPPGTPACRGADRTTPLGAANDPGADAHAVGGKTFAGLACRFLAEERQAD
jgi:hypothetical protein